MQSIPRNEYPRPRFVRPGDTWTCLNGTWEFEILSTEPGPKPAPQTAPDHFTRTITVPFAPESRLSGVAYTDYMTEVAYRRTCSCPALSGDRLLIRFGAVDYVAHVFINGIKVGTHTGGYTPFSFDITGFVTPGENTVTVYVFDDTRCMLQPCGKQSIHRENMGCCYTRTTGIWQTVWLERVPRVYIEDVRITPDIDNRKADLRVTLSGCCGRGLPLTAEIRRDGRTLFTVTAKTNSNTAAFSAVFPEEEALRLWSPEDPFLYDLILKTDTDELQTYFGMRKVCLNGYAIEINDKPVFQRLVLDQGFYPDGIYTAPSVEDIRRDVELSMQAGFNGARLHMKIFEPYMTYYADHSGYLLWGEFPNWGMDWSNPSILRTFLPDWRGAFRRDYSAPSVIGWCPLNEVGENRDELSVRTVYEMIREEDPFRPCIPTSGYYHVPGLSRIFDTHDYVQDAAELASHYDDLPVGEHLKQIHAGTSPCNAYTPGLPVFVSEFGGTRWDIDGKADGVWGYGTTPETLEELYARLEGLVKALVSNPHILGFCYTQLTDVMQEVNGIYSFDRRPKCDTDRIRRIFRQKAAVED